ncbi:hypothetical protein REPUB_Repub12eG0174100 [Reevesia pubescens]
MNPMNTTLKSLPNKKPCQNGRFCGNVEDGTSLSKSSNGNTYKQGMERRIECKRRREEAPLSEGTMSRRLRTKTYSRQDKTSSDDQLAVLDKKSEPCSICLIDYEEQEKVAMLYYCKHTFHVECIKKWLLHKNQCPICRCLALIPEFYPDWEGDIEEHQSYFTFFYNYKRRNKSSNSAQAS